jgi:hypothetical protein
MSGWAIVIAGAIVTLAGLVCLTGLIGENRK